MVKGPGPFTAVRIAIAHANTFSYALDIPVFGVKYEEDKVNSEGRESALGHKKIEDLIENEVKKIKYIKPGKIVKPTEKI